MTVRRVDLVFPRFKLLSGAERAVLGLAHGLSEAGHRVRVVCHQFHDSCRARLADEVELVCTNVRLDWSANRYLNAVADYARCFGLGRFLDDRADVHVLFGPALPLVTYLRWIEKSRRPVVYYCWEPPRVLYQDRELVLARLGWRRVPMRPALRAYARVDRWLVGLVDAICTSSPFAARQVETAYGRPAAVITLGVDRERLDAEPVTRPTEPPTILTVNYLHPRKRVDLIVRAAAVLREQWTARRSPRWVIVGDGPERSRLEALARELGLGGVVEFAGFVSDNLLPRYYAAASCYVHAGLDESFGLSVIEAAYRGCPVVAVAEGGVCDTVEDGVTGFLVPPDPCALARAVCNVLIRPDEGRALGAAGRERVGQVYRWARGAQQILDLARPGKTHARDGRAAGGERR